MLSQQNLLPLFRLVIVIFENLFQNAKQTGCPDCTPRLFYISVFSMWVPPCGALWRMGRGLTVPGSGDIGNGVMYFSLPLKIKLTYKFRSNRLLSV